MKPQTRPNTSHGTTTPPAAFLSSFALGPSYKTLRRTAVEGQQVPRVYCPDNPDPRLASSSLPKHPQNIAPFDAEGRSRNIARHVEADDLRLAVYLAPEENPVKLLLRLFIHAGFDVPPEDVGWAEESLDDKDALRGALSLLTRASGGGCHANCSSVTPAGHPPFLVDTPEIVYDLTTMPLKKSQQEGASTRPRLTEAEKHDAIGEALDMLDEMMADVEAMQEAADRIYDTISRVPGPVRRGSYTHESQQYARTIGLLGNELKAMAKVCKEAAAFNPVGLRRKIKDARNMLAKHKPEGATHEGITEGRKPTHKRVESLLGKAQADADALAKEALQHEGMTRVHLAKAAQGISAQVQNAKAGLAAGLPPQVLDGGVQAREAAQQPLKLRPATGRSPQRRTSPPAAWAPPQPG